MKEPEFVKRTLQWCNERRAERGKSSLRRLPRGSRYDGNSCPCGKATGLFVGRTTYCKQDRKSGHGTFIGNVPSFVTKFTFAFDGGHLPQYDINAEYDTSAEWITSTPK